MQLDRLMSIEGALAKKKRMQGNKNYIRMIACTCMYKLIFVGIINYAALSSYTMLLYKNLDITNSNVFTTNSFISAHPHFDIVCGRIWQLLVEPRRSVEPAA